MFHSRPHPFFSHWQSSSAKAVTYQALEWPVHPVYPARSEDSYNGISPFRSDLESDRRAGVSRLRDASVSFGSIRLMGCCWFIRMITLSTHTPFTIQQLVCEEIP